MLKWILAGVAALVIVFVVVVALQPSDFRIERSATIRAPAIAPYTQVNDFHNWRAWSPWEKVDPALKRAITSYSPKTSTSRRPISSTGLVCR